MREDIDRVEQRLHLAVDERRGFAFGSREFFGLDLAGRIHREHAFLGEPGKQHSDGGHNAV
jgi:hypothetical protein